MLKIRSRADPLCFSGLLLLFAAVFVVSGTSALPVSDTVRRCLLFFSAPAPVAEVFASAAAEKVIVALSTILQNMSFFKKRGVRKQ